MNTIRKVRRRLLYYNIPCRCVCVIWNKLKKQKGGQSRWVWGDSEGNSRTDNCKYCGQQTAVNIHRWSYTRGRGGLHLGDFWIGYKHRSHEKRQTAREVGVHRETSRGSHDKYVCSLSVDGGSKAAVSENWAVEDSRRWEKDSRMSRCSAVPLGGGFGPQACVPHRYLFRCPQHLANFEDCVNFTGPREERPEGVHFGHDAAHGPHVNGGAVVGGPQQHLRSPVPAGRRDHWLVLPPTRSKRHAQSILRDSVYVFLFAV